MKLFGQTIRLLEANLDRRTHRHRLISRNLSNIDTPGYQGTRIFFEENLRKALDGDVMPTQLATTHANHLPEGVKKAFSEAPSEFLTDGDVQIDIEMAKLSENNLMFQAMTQLLNKKYEVLKTAIKADQGA